MIRTTLTDIKNNIIMALISNQELVKALVVEDSDFLDSTPSDKDSEVIKNPRSLIRNQIFPYRKMIDITTEAKVYITMEFSDFERESNSKYRSGVVTFYVICPPDVENTIYGSRYDWIADKIEEIFNKSNIGDVEPISRGDVYINDRFLGHYVSCSMTDFYIVK